MAEPRSFASLSSGLLARKGAAKPAMRPQSFGQMGAGLDDLGWNDMGYHPAQPVPEPEPLPYHVPSSIAALTPAPRLDEADPPVVEQQRAIAERFRDEEPEQVEPEQVEAAPAPTAPAPTVAEVVQISAKPAKRPAIKAATPAASKAPAKSKAAFTLRLDADRHLRLRLASAVTGRSAQKVVTEALDHFLSTIAELDELAGHVPARTARRN